MSDPRFLLISTPVVSWFQRLREPNDDLTYTDPTKRLKKEDEYLMMMDPNNPVVKLCIAGMQAEGEGDHELARGLFVQAWEVAGDHYEACVAAHYLARHQPNPEETLRWNQESLRLAEAVGDDRVRDFFPSLLLNVGHSYEVLGNIVEARR